MIPKKLGKRALTTGIGAAVLILFMLVLPKWCFHLFLVAAGLVGLREADRVVTHTGFVLYWEPVAVAIFLGVASVYLPDWMQLEYVAYMIVAFSFLRPLTGSGDLKQSLPNAGVSLAMSAYLGFAVVSLAYLLSLEGPLASGMDTGRALLAFCIFMVWSGDSAAYLVGSMIGKNKIAPVISPGKTWEGTIANLFGNFLFVLVAKYTFVTELAFRDLLVLTLIFGPLGFYGDLIESTWKRGSGIKDSSTLLPGHGGILDRIDSIFLTAPLFFLYMTRVVLA